jgi:hypothetical protein
VGALNDLVSKNFERAVVPFVNREISSIGVAAALALRADPDRLGFVLVNLSANTIHVGPFADVSSTKGIRLPSSGGAIIVDWHEDFEMVGMDWYAIADGAASALITVEYLAP